MPTEKFSAFASAGTFGSTDEIVGLVGADNARFLRSVLNTYGAGGPIFLNTPASYVYIDDTPDIEIAVGSGGTINWLWNFINVLSLDSSGNFTISGPGGKPFNILNQGANITIDAAGIISVISKSNASSIVSYTPSNSADWQTSDPPDMAAAINRIAAAVAGLLGGPIP